MLSRFPNQAADIPVSRGGRDDIQGDNGDDVIFGGYQNGSPGGVGTKLGDGNDVINGRTDRVGLYGEDGNDLLKGGIGEDDLHGGFGEDILEEGKYSDRLEEDNFTRCATKAGQTLMPQIVRGQDCRG